MLKQVVSRRLGPGDKVAEFEAALAKHTGFKHVSCCNSGTTALMLAIWSTGSRSIMVPSYTFSAAANAARMCGCNVRQREINNLLVLKSPEPHLIANTVVFVSHNGEMRGLMDWTSQPDTTVIHDAAQSLDMLTPRGEALATTSFSVPKLVTTGQGGAVFTNDDERAKDIRALLDHGGGKWRSTRIHEAIGGNFRMMDLAAALGCVQLSRIDSLVEIRKDRYVWYHQYGFPSMPIRRWTACIRSTQAPAVIAALANKGYEALQPYRPLQESVPYKHLTPDPEAIKAADELVYLPAHWMLKKRDVQTICKTILEVDKCASPK